MVDIQARIRAYTEAHISKSSSIGLPSLKGWGYLLNSTAKINLAVGSVRSGKTVTAGIRWADYVANAPPGLLLVAGKSERTVKRNVIDPLTEFLGSDQVKIRWGLGEGTILGRDVFVVGANDERAEGKIRGSTLAGALGDEITLWPKSFYYMMLSRLSVRGSKFFGTTNPDSPRHWLKQDFINNRRLRRCGDMRVFNWRLDDNPYLDPLYVASLKRQYSGLWYKRFIQGLWCLAEGSVYDMFDEKRHVYSGDVPFVVDHFITGIDYGTANPFTVGLYAIGQKPLYNGYAALVKSWRWDAKKQGRQKTDSQLADAYNKFIDGVQVKANYVDPSAASFITELRARNIKVTKANNSVVEGIQFISSMFNTGRFMMHESCTDDIAEYNGYVWDEKKVARGIDAPLKVDDHAPDRDRYALNTHLGGKGLVIFA